MDFAGRAFEFIGALLVNSLVFCYKESGQPTNCDWVPMQSPDCLNAAAQCNISQALIYTESSLLISAGESGSFYNVIQDVNHQVTVSISGTPGRSMSAKEQ